MSSAQLIADDIVELVLTRSDNGELPGWQPGAHIELRLPSGLSRQYSLCGDPSDLTSYRIAVLRETDGRGGSREVHAVAAPGLVLSVRPPRNDFPLVTADSYVFIGGGIGITPILPMVGEVDRAGADWTLIYGGRSTTTMAYRDDLGTFGDRVDLWVQDERGYPDLPGILAAAPAGAMVYTCGPDALIDAVAGEFTRHAHLGGLHFERFAASGPVDTSGDSFEVELRHTGVTFNVVEGGSILQEVQKILPNHPFSCEEGYCGECETKVLDGQPDHRDDYLTPEEQQDGDVMMICVSRCKGERLVLDL
ncbi:PDR/VanB family oxidoreductase [Mycolicibacterium neoaurum]|nr:PDR/VanB family oxidoreductase [Mycolicibacterium neoaurum]MDO3402762.1 PDR/VanB family oxidoreductase [Mycolicibacterium neoaurum]